MDQFNQFCVTTRALPRPGTDQYFLLMAYLVSIRGTCQRRRVGCVLTDQYNKVIATGYNGVAAGLPHCLDHACPGAHLPSGTGLDKCEALHAEENALIQCTRPQDIYTVYCTASPCNTCVRKLKNTSAQRIVFSELYPHPESEAIWCGYGQHNGRQLELTGRKWIHLPIIS